MSRSYRIYRTSAAMICTVLTAALVIAWLKYNNTKWTPIASNSNFALVDDSELKRARVGEENTDHIVVDQKDLAAEMESQKRKNTVENVCRKYNLTNILAPPADPKDRKRAKQISNLRKHFVLSEKYKVLVCFIPKAGCTTLKKLLVVMDNLSPLSIEKIQRENNIVVFLNHKKFTEEQREHMLKNYYKFMIVRDPFERLVSAFRNKILGQWREHYRPLGKRIIKKYRQNKTGDDVTFTEFVRHLIDTAPWQLDDHWMPHEDLCRPCDVKYDFIGSIDTLERDLDYVMRKIHANETKHHINQDSGALAKTKLLTASFFKKVPKEYFDKLLAIRKTDFELFGYPLPKYESLDKHYHASINQSIKFI